ncbi:MAG: hypothetical protein FD161_2112 [Limisphaerales bacterium]|nr:MAG: hypothetical protein FD161_2112 [Limisphaerales bacterium]KAG0508818.1 MAG: hypothetical protein E1N63_1914 [Limisphaerales bacterium]TXT49722.1 MAG: hypothetical protein FD140_2876 [Limisphaerales bacterium]
MSIGPTKLLALGAGLVIAAGILAVVLAKRHEKRLAVAGALAVAALQTEASNATSLGTARGIRIPFYEGGAGQPTSVMLGRTAEPMEGGKYLVNDLRVENYSYGPGGTVTNFVIEAPRCLIDPARKVASSDGLFVMSLSQGGNRLLTRGSSGFEWQQQNSLLTVSNEVSTHISMNDPKPVRAVAP